MTKRLSGQDVPSVPRAERRERLYTDKELGDLIRLATHRQENEEVFSRRGLPLSEIERIASEVGLDPRHVRAAANELEYAQPSDQGKSLTGGPFVIGQKRVVEGAVSEADWEEIVPELRSRLGGTGRVGQLGQTWEWTRMVKDLDLVLLETQVSIRPDVDQTTIDIRTRYGGGASVTYLLGAVLSATAAAAFLDSAGQSGLVDALVLGASGFGGLAAARASISAWSQRQRRKLRNVINWLDSRIAATQPLPSPSFFEYPNPGSALAESPGPVRASHRQESAE